MALDVTHAELHPEAVAVALGEADRVAEALLVAQPEPLPDGDAVPVAHSVALEVPQALPVPEARTHSCSMKQAWKDRIFSMPRFLCTVAESWCGGPLA